MTSAQLAIDSVKSHENPPETVAVQNEDAGCVLGLLATLSANQQEVIRLRFQSGLSYREIGRVTGLSVTNVGYLIHTAIKTIRERLPGQGGNA